jgi:hypothetical protein
MPQLVKETIHKYETVTNKTVKAYTTPGTPGKTLLKHQGNPEYIDNYRSIVGKIMYLTTKLAPELSNAAR